MSGQCTHFANIRKTGFQAVYCRLESGHEGEHKGIHTVKLTSGSQKGRLLLYYVTWNPEQVTVRLRR